MHRYELYNGLYNLWEKFPIKKINKNLFFKNQVSKYITYENRTKIRNNLERIILKQIIYRLR